MALTSVFRQSKRLDGLRTSLKPLATQGGQITTSYRFKHQKEEENKENSSNYGANWNAATIGISTGIAAFGLFTSNAKSGILAEEPDELEQVMKKEIIDQENR